MSYNSDMTRTRQLILDRYRPIAEAGAGSFGTVQVAWDTRIQRKVAIKCIELDEKDAMRAVFSGTETTAAINTPAQNEYPSDISCNDNEEARLLHQDFDSANISVAEASMCSAAPVLGLDEARTAALLSDAGIVAVYDFEVQDSMAYLIMEYVEGITLRDLLYLYNDRITLDVVAAVFAAVSRALEVAHDNKVLHLDIKPDNILINRQGQVKVTDFGLAILADTSGFNAAGGGTIGYMPPEQIRQECLDERCDEWALASVVYEMLTGVNPFLAPDLKHAETAIEDAELVLPSLCWDELDSAIDDVIFYALDPDRTERYATVSDFADELEPFLGDSKRGTRELAALVGCSDDEREEHPEERQAFVPTPLRDRITPLQRKIAAHVVGGAGSAFVAFIALINIPHINGLSSALFWGLLSLIALGGALKPHLGALLAYLALSAAFIVQNAPAVGCILLAAVLLWWYFIGRKGSADANVALAAPVAGALGLGQMVPLVAGLSLSPIRAIMTTLFTITVSVLFASCGSYSLFNWDVFAHWNFEMCDNLLAALKMLLGQAPLWCIAASWCVAAILLAVFRLRATRLRTVLGVCVAGACLLVGIGFAAWTASGGTTWLPSLRNLIFTLSAITLAFMGCVFIPDSGGNAKDDTEDLEDS